MKKTALIVLMVMVLSSCKFIEKIGNYSQYVEKIEFKNGKYILYEGDAEVCYVTAEPADSFEWYETKYFIENSDVVSFEDCTDNYCIVKALKEGTSIITAKLGEKEGKTVITVRKKN